MRTSLVLIFLIMISITNSLSLKSQLRTKDPIPLKELMHNILKDNVKLKKYRQMKPLYDKMIHFI